jgi:acyl carrier protein
MQRNAVTERIRNFLIKHFSLARSRAVSDDEPLIGNGIMDSLGILEVVAFLEQEFQVTVTDEELLPENFQSIASLAAYIQHKLNHVAVPLAEE